MTREKREIYACKRRFRRQKRRWRIEKRRAKRRMREGGVAHSLLALACAALIFLAAAFVCGVNAGMIAGAENDIGAPTASDGYAVAVVFGAKVHEGGALSHMLADRMDTAIALYHSGAVQKLLLSGDGRGQWSETKYMRLHAIENGVAAEDIIEDGQGYSTLETVRRAKEIYNIEKCVLVTQEYHLYRAIYIAEQSGMEVRGVSADLRTYFGQIKRDVREVFARVKDFLLCIG